MRAATADKISSFVGEVPDAKPTIDDFLTATGRN